MNNTVGITKKMVEAGLDALYKDLPEKSPSGAESKNLDEPSITILRICMVYTAMRLADQSN